MGPFEVGATFNHIDYDLLSLLCGDEQSQQYEVKVTQPIKRKWWEWLLHRPRRYNYYVIPHATFAVQES